MTAGEDLTTADADHRGRTTQRRRRQCRLIAACSTIAVLTGGVASALVLSETGRPTGVIAPTTTAPPTAVVLPDQGPFTVATTKVAQLSVYGQPNAAAAVLATLPAKSTYESTTTLLADPDVPRPPSGWVPVTVPLRKPNETKGWVQASDVTLSQTSDAIDISLSQHTLVLRIAGHPVLSTRIIIGAPKSPTPTGRFFLTDPINCNTTSVPGYPLAQCSPVYGAFAIGTSGLSDALDSFDGTIPQIALHGTNVPASQLGTDQSNGCVRMPNDVIIQIARLTPLLGTPVMITA